MVPSVLESWPRRQLQYDQFDVGQVVGTGSFGVVYKAYWLPAGKYVALKRLSSTVAQKDLHKEVEVLSNISHEFVLSFIGVIPSPLHLVTEFCEHGSLYSFMRHVKHCPDLFPWEHRLRIALEAAQGMSYLHTINICHRDFKSPNILLDSNWHVRIADFGLSRFIVDSLVPTTMGASNPCWMAPELLQLQPAPYSKSCDVYSFATLLWELMTLDVPFGDLDWVQAWFHVSNYLTPDLPDLDDIPGGTFAGLPQYIELIHSCWSRDQSARPSFAEIAARLAGIIYLHPFRDGVASVGALDCAWSDMMDDGDASLEEYALQLAPYRHLQLHPEGDLQVNGEWEMLAERPTVIVEQCSAIWRCSQQPVCVYRVSPKQQWDVAAQHDCTKLVLHVVEVMYKLSHPCIQRLYGFALTPHALLVMEDAPGGRLLSRLMAARVSGVDIPWTQRLGWALECALALQYLNERGILFHGHCGASLGLTHTDTPMLRWFGWATYNKKTSPQGMGLSARYCAPDVLHCYNNNNGAGSCWEVTAASDVYRFGVLLWELMYCRLPFDHLESGMQVLAARLMAGESVTDHHVEGAVELRGLPPDCMHLYRELTAGCCSEDPNDRPDMQTVVTQLKGIVAAFHRGSKLQSTRSTQSTPSFPGVASLAEYWEAAPGVKSKSKTLHRHEEQLSVRDGAHGDEEMSGDGQGMAVERGGESYGRSSVGAQCHTLAKEVHEKRVALLLLDGIMSRLKDMVLAMRGDKLRARSVMSDTSDVSCE